MGVSITHICKVLKQLRVMAIKDPLAITPEEDEEQMIMRRLRNSCDELKRGYRWLDYRMQRVKQKADQSKEQRENIELQSEENPFHSRLTSPWMRSSSTGRIRRPAAGGLSTRVWSSTTAQCSTSAPQSD